MATRQGERIYVQVSYDISDEATFARETGALLAIKDAYPKMIITHSRQPEWQYEGIRIVDIADFLLRK